MEKPLVVRLELRIELDSDAWSEIFDLDPSRRSEARNGVKEFVMTQLMTSEVLAACDAKVNGVRIKD